MGRTGQYVFAIIGVMIALFAIMIDHYPKDVWEHAVAWWGLVAAAATLIASTVGKMLIGFFGGAFLNLLTGKTIGKTKIRGRRRQG